VIEKQPSTSDSDKAHEFYESFKKSYNNNVSTVINDEQKQEKEGIKENINQIKLIDIENRGLQRKLTYNYCIIGRNLKYLKENMRMTDDQLDSHFKDCIGFSKSMRNFYIRYYKLALVYNKLMYVEILFREIIKYFKYLEELIEQDKDFWM